MIFKGVQAGQVFNKAYSEQSIREEDFRKFKTTLAEALKNVAEALKSQTEAHLTNLISDFLKKTFYASHNVNCSSFCGQHEADLVIRLGSDLKSPVGALIEVKKADNVSEMISEKEFNKKALHEAVVYYLQERIKFNNPSVASIIITTGYDWYFFDAVAFRERFYDNKELLRHFENWLAGSTDVHKTASIYEFVKRHIDLSHDEIAYVRFNFNPENGLFASNEAETIDNDLRNFYKYLHPTNLFKQSYVNDSNELNKDFYQELLYLIGLEEDKEGGKVVIRRCAEVRRHSGSLLENTIKTLQYDECLSELKDSDKHGVERGEILFNVALELNLTWINRILFLKLLEAQLIGFHRGNKNFAFLNCNRVKEFDDLNTLFFQVLAIKEEDRDRDIQKDFSHIPYLNSSLFEKAEIEIEASMRISNLRDRIALPLFPRTALTDRDGNRLRNAELPFVEYLMRFLDAYDFGAESRNGLRLDTAKLINASVLGLIFEKINGYRDGSFFTPGFITMYMCREAIRRALIDKFNVEFEWNCDDFTALSNCVNKLNSTQDIEKANKVVDSLTVCDPAVGSGHFLVSALNEIIAAKADLGILADESLRTFSARELQITVDNDELSIRRADGDIFKYSVGDGNRPNPADQRIQKTIFEEKKRIIENCLFGVDINPNSVKICRLRLWIELLKHAYYIEENGNHTHLKTLPNIDINIKQGNSLISRFKLRDEQLTGRGRIQINGYKFAVQSYREAEKDAKRALQSQINKFKNEQISYYEFKSDLSKKAEKYTADLYELDLKLSGGGLGFGLTDKQREGFEEKREKTLKNLEKVNAEIEKEKERARTIFKNAFEWRFEFPEALDDDGNYKGFDVVIGNPPYIQLQKDGGKLAELCENQNFETFARTGDIYSLFYEKGWQLLRTGGYLCFITSNKWMRAGYGEKTREFFVKRTQPIGLIDFAGFKMFDAATVDTNILLFKKPAEPNTLEVCKTKACVVGADFNRQNNLSDYFKQNTRDWSEFKGSSSWIILDRVEKSIKEKIEALGTPLKDWDVKIYRGILTGYNEAFIIDGKKRAELIAKDPKSEEIIRPILRGRDIKRYYADFADLWLVATHSGYTKEDGNVIPPIDIEEYPVVKEHLDRYWNKIAPRADQGNTPYNLRSCNYMEDFNKQKIVYPNMTKFLPFAIDLNEHFFHNDKTFHIVSNSIYWLGAFLNSRIFKYCFRDNFPELLGGTRELRKVFFDAIPVMKIQKSIENTIFKPLLESFIQKMTIGKSYKDEIIEIETTVARLYSLSEKESHKVINAELGYLHTEFD